MLAIRCGLKCLSPDEGVKGEGFVVIESAVKLQSRLRVFIMRPHKTGDPSNKVKVAADADGKLCSDSRIKPDQVVTL